ncbi:LysM peptidoglycan-binding domain-containing protein [Cohaesibacter sp. CAU 1516]|uniref:LysM peptidoglycan-binding domain-containing protein n=1 Tax=Cohaesibacter sp. CAU 1516 TaxID=2576038 RepID=UPI0010FF52EF|nr:LysM peptidoglycan-binding domain-containing protein [Cohaesibacter sp. CAU 1516]TLP48897.1 LysM peptidoglycan-binding domain-containing protein [Cohaesibacter sp. CAU 1516]
MKPAALLMAVGGGVIAVALGVFVFADQLGLGNKTTPEKPAVTETAMPLENAAKAPDVDEPKTDEKPAVQPEAKQPEPAPVKEVAENNQPTDAEPAVTEPAKAAEPDVTSEAKPEAPAPSFDVVRVEPNGETLVAGKASPGWLVELKNGEETLAKAVADANGDWVMLLAEALEQGVSDLSLMASSKDGANTVASTSNVTVALPEDGSGELLVIETAPGQASKVLAKLAAPKAEAPKTEPMVAPAQPDAAVEPEKTAQAADPATSEASDPAVEAANDDTPAAPVEQAKAPVEETKPEVEKPTAVMNEAKAPVEPVAEVKSEDSAAEMVKQEEKPAEEPKEVDPEAASSNQLVSIEAVEIEGDVLFIAGAAEPAGSIVRLYVDNRAVSDQRSGETGRYLFDGKLKLNAGEHRARVDLLDTKRGVVAKRAEVVFTKKASAPVESESKPAVVAEADPAGATSDTPAPVNETPAASQPVKTKKVIIRRGDNLWEIARRVYGAGIRYSTIYDGNIEQIRNPNLIYPGQVFELPEGEDGWERNFDAVEAPPEGAADAMDGADATATSPANGG